jgi:membrane protein implicated in regulation of membrane protease activity
MGAIYLGSLIVGLGILLLQVGMSSGKDLDGGGKSLDFDGDGDADHGMDHGQAGDGHFVGLFLSFRFWTFALASFGMVGSALHFLALASATTALLASGAFGLIAGLGAAWTFRTLGKNTVNSGADVREIVGQVGKVMLPPNADGRAKVRLLVKGQLVDYLATSDDPSLLSGASVLVEEVRGNEVHVSPAPAGLKYSDDQN